MIQKKRISRRTGFEYGEERGRDLMEVFNREYEICDCLGMMEVLRIAVNCPARRFWVSEERAFRVVSSMYRRPLPDRCHPLKREMYEEIKRRCDLLSEEHPDWPLSRRVYEVVRHEAPKFYLSVSAAHAVLTEARETCRRKQMQRLRHLLRAAS